MNPLVYSPSRRVTDVSITQLSAATIERRHLTAIFLKICSYEWEQLVFANPGIHNYPRDRMKRMRISILQNFCSDSTFLEHPKHSSNAKHSHICIIGIIAFLFRQLSLYMRESERHSVVVPRTSSPENRLDDDTQQTLSYSFYVVTA